MTSILYYAPLWLRDPGNFRGQSLRELIDHLFVDELRKVDPNTRTYFTHHVAYHYCVRNSCTRKITHKSVVLKRYDTIYL